MWVCLAAHGVRFAHLDQVLAWYREHPRGVSRQSLPLAYARLHAYQALRELGLGPGIIDLDQVIAGRHHVLGIRLWQENRQTEARMHFRQAICLDQGWQLYRRALVVLSYLFSMDRAVRMLNLLQRARRRA